MLKSDNSEYGSEQEKEELARDFLNGYRLCADMLNLRRYERKRGKAPVEPFHAEDILAGNETFWLARMYEVEHLLGSLRNGREKLILYYRYIRGESVEHAADILGVSRRTGYRIHRRGLLVVGAILERKKKSEVSFPEEE